jgi:uncharacterized protein YbcI
MRNKSAETSIVEEGFCSRSRKAISIRRTRFNKQSKGHKEDQQLKRESRVGKALEELVDCLGKEREL